MGRKIINFLKKSFEEGTQIGKGNILAAFCLGPLAHMGLFVFYTYIIPTSYESLNLRVFLSALCLATIFYYKIPESAKVKIFPFYWHFMVLMVLPFQCTFFLLKTNFDELYLYWQIFCVMLMILYIPHWFMALTDLIISMLLAIAAYYITSGYSFVNLDLENFNFFGYSKIFFFVVISSLVFVHTNRKSWLVKQSNQYNKLTAIAGSIAHEMRNPISAIRLSSQTLPEDDDLKKSNKVTDADIESIIDHKDIVAKTVKLANEIIDMTLHQLSGKKIESSDFSYLRASEMIKDSVSIYGYKSQEERKKVKSDIKEDFIISAVETPFKYILFNLIKNALYYLNQHPKSIVTIGTSTSKIGDKNYNVIYVHDTGPGIPPELLKKLFGSFVTSGKSEGTGLGLAFCKRTMIDFGGDIDCESEYGKWTRFNLYFPQLSDEEIKEAEEQLKILEDNSSLVVKTSTTKIKNPKKEKPLKKILVVDDQEINLKISNKLIKSLDANVKVDLAYDGKEALDLVKKNKKDQYDLIITDIQMPKIDGFGLTKEIRKFDQELPIAAYTSRTSYKVKQHALDIGIDDYIIKPIPNNGLLRVVYKWIVNDHIYNYDLEQIKDSFKGLKVLIADDEMINIMVLKKYLVKYDIEVETVSDGNELIDKYKSQFPEHDLEELDKNDNPNYEDPDLTNQYDIIVADINMPGKKGDEAAKEIRDFELVHNIQNKAIIIANSGDGDEDKLKAMLKSGMDDYFLKGEDNSKLMQIIYFWLNYSQNKQDPSYLNIDNKEHTIDDAKKESQIINSRFQAEELKEFKDIFISSTKDLIKKIKESNKDKNVEDLAFHSHALKGMAGNVGAEKLFLYISMVNGYAKRDKWPKEKNWLKELEEIADITLQEFEGF